MRVRGEVTGRGEGEGKKGGIRGRGEGKGKKGG